MDQKLAIIDWGIGGLGIYRKVKERLGDVAVTYLSDTGATPYGIMGRGELISRLNDVLDFLEGRGVTHVVVGCNAASTAIGFLDPKGLKIEGVIDSAVAATLRRNPERLGLIGGRRTVVSGVYRNAFDARGLKVRQRIAQPLSGLIESGDTGSDRLKAECERILTPLKNCTHILLACTHYPAIASVMAGFVSDETEFIDPSAELVRKVSDWNFRPGGDDVFLTSGDPRQMAAAAVNAFSVHIPTAHSVSIPQNSAANTVKSY
jgi:glutamate racemase